MEVTVAIPNDRLRDMASNQGYINSVVAQLQKHKNIINLVITTNYRSVVNKTHKQNYNCLARRSLTIVQDGLVLLLGISKHILPNFGLFKKVDATKFTK